MKSLDNFIKNAIEFTNVLKWYFFSLELVNILRFYSNIFYLTGETSPTLWDFLELNESHIQRSDVERALAQSKNSSIYENAKDDSSADVNNCFPFL